MLKRYLIRQFAISFLPVFATLLIVSSVIVLFQIAKVTSYVQLDLRELFKLYLLMSVKLLLFTIPISYFIALGSCFKRLSNFNESVILFALGLKPRALAVWFSSLAALFSAFLFFIAAFFIPTSFNLYDNFIDYKKTIANISLKTANYGQKIGDWIVYSHSQKGTSMYDVSLKNVKTNELAFAKSAQIAPSGSWLVLQLDDINYYDLAQGKILHLEHLELKSSLGELKGTELNAFAYWKDFRAKSKEIVIYLSLALLPLACTLWQIAWGITYDRVENSKLNTANFIYLGLYFIPMILFAKGHFITVGASFVVFSLLSWLAFFRLKKY